jgi:phosphonate transport system ATP-binding protein
MRIELEQLAARHPAAGADAPPALKPLSLTIAPGEQVAVIGPSGAGKTTLLHALACALKPTAGHLLLDGADPWTLPVAHLQRLRGRLFLAPQTPPLPPRQRVITAVLAARLPRQSLWRSLRSLLYPDDIPGAHRALARFDLAPKLWERVDRLSGGERQRVGLDPTRAQQAVANLTQAAREREVTLVATLHQVDVATRFARVIGLRDGELAFDLPGSEVTRTCLTALYAQHEHELTDAAPWVEPAAPARAPLPVTVVCR